MIKVRILIGLAMPAMISPLLTANDSSELFAASLQPVFKEHCIKCHGKDGKIKGKVDLVALNNVTDLLAHPDLLETMIGALEDREMPPEDEPPITEELRRNTIKHLETILTESLADGTFEATPIRRMNRFQYNNAVIDLLELDREIFQLNERLMRRYEDYFHPETGKIPDHVQVASRPLSKDIDGRRPEGFRGVAPFPQDQRAEHGFDNRADHLTLSPLLMESFLTLSQTIVESPDLNAQECRSWNWLFAKPGALPVGKFEAENHSWLKLPANSQGRIWVQEMKGFGSHWSDGKHLIWMCRKKEWEIEFTFEALTTGDGLRFGFTRAPDYGTFELSLDGKVIGDPVDLYDSKVSRAEDIVIPVRIEPGTHRLKIKCLGINKKSKSHLFAIDTFKITGVPKEEPKSGTMTDEEAIRNRLTRLTRRAFRRVIEPEELDRFATFAKNNLATGASFEETMRTLVGAVLASPDFLYFYETGENQKSGSQSTDDFELASRLALFLWGSIPDDELLDAAETGTLKEPEVLSGQIDRMLNDVRMSRFCDSFPAQWLQLERLITAVPAPKKYDYFYYNGYRVSMHMMMEPLLLFETIYLENRSVMDLLDPDFTWQSDMLRANYEGKAIGENPQVLKFNRVPLDDPHRGGVITNAAVMTMTSTPTRTQPITRGSWVNAVIFNDPPEPPPADVPVLPEVDEARLETLTIRERLAEHRQRKDCAGCHNQIDPFGFALENYSPTGVWRDTYENGRPVDSSGVLFNQYDFTTVVEFKKLLLQEKRRFIRGFTAHLLSYGLGRKLGPADSPALDEIADLAMEGEDEMRTLLKRVAMSAPFLHKTPHEN